jgi:hypothetical protein
MTTTTERDAAVHAAAEAAQRAIDPANAAEWAQWAADLDLRSRYVFRDDATTAALVRQAGRDAAAEAQRATWRWLESWERLPWDTLVERVSESLRGLGRADDFISAFLRDFVHGRWTRGRLAAYAISVEADRRAVLAADRAEQEAGLALSARHRESDAPVFGSMAAWRSAPAELRDDVRRAADAWSRLRQQVYDDPDAV